MRRKKIEVAVDEAQEAFSWRGVARRGRIDHFAKLAKKIFQHGAMQAALVSEIVVKHRLVGVRRGGDFIGARAGQALRGEMLVPRRPGFVAPSPGFPLFCVLASSFPHSPTRFIMGFRIARAGRRATRRQFVDACEIRGIESDICQRPRFSSRYFRRFVPGIGTISSPCASTQASASCAGVHFFSAAISLDAFHQFEILLEIVALKARGIAAIIVQRKIFELVESARLEIRARAGYRQRIRFQAPGKRLGFRPPDRASRASIRFASAVIG